MGDDLRRLAAAIWSLLGAVSALLTIGAVIAFVLSAGGAPWWLAAAVLAVAAAIFLNDRKLLAEKDRRLADLEQRASSPAISTLPKPSLSQSLQDWHREIRKQSYESDRDRQREERETRKKALDGLQREYVDTYEGTEKVNPAIRAGTAPAPRDWMKQRLREMFPSESVRIWLFPDYFREEIEARKEASTQQAAQTPPVDSSTSAAGTRDPELRQRRRKHP